MRHLTRLYFDNLPVEGATELFISLVDHGVDADQNPVYSVMTGSLSMPMTLSEQFQALRYLQATACFFKLPVGASAVIDVYIPDESGSSAPKSFDYQVTKARIPEKETERLASALDTLKSTFEPLMSCEQPGVKPSSTAGSVAVAGPAGPAKSLFSLTGATAPSCYNSGSTGPCGSQTSIPCMDPLTQRAICNGTHLECVDSEPGGGEP